MANTDRKNVYLAELGPVTLINKIKQQPFKEWAVSALDDYKPKWFLIDSGDIQWTGSKYLKYDADSDTYSEAL